LKYNNLIWKIALPELAVAVSKPRAMSCGFTCSQSSSWIAQNSVEIQKLERKNSSSHMLTQSSSLIAQNLVEIQISNMENTTVGTGNGYEQAQGHEL
jgi:hypothetical protein